MLKFIIESSTKTNAPLLGLLQQRRATHLQLLLNFHIWAYRSNLYHTVGTLDILVMRNRAIFTGETNSLQLVASNKCNYE